MQLQSGTTLLNGRFRIESCIGDGGFGITYLAMDERLGREVVLKEYFPDYMVKRDTTTSFEVHTIDPGFSDEFHTGIKKFLNEAKVLAKLNNIPAIADVHDFFEENNTAYIVMEYIEGQNLKQLIKSRQDPFSFKEATKIMMPCVFALQKVHETGIIHRDLAPDNILINDLGQAKIIDFGSSRDYVSQNATLTIMVKHGYAPAEQYSGAVKQGPYTDVYSLGAILYQMVTLKKPITSVDRLFNDTLKAPIELNPLITKRQSDVIMKALAVSYTDRYQTVEELLKALNVARNTEDPVESIQPQNTPVVPQPQSEAYNVETQYMPYNMQPQYEPYNSQQQYVPYNMQPQYESYNAQPQYAQYGQYQYAPYGSQPQYESYNNMQPQYAQYDFQPQNGQFVSEQPIQPLNELNAANNYYQTGDSTELVSKEELQNDGAFTELVSKEEHQNDGAFTELVSKNNDDDYMATEFIPKSTLNELSMFGKSNYVTAKSSTPTKPDDKADKKAYLSSLSDKEGRIFHSNEPEAKEVDEFDAFKARQRAEKEAHKKKVRNIVIAVVAILFAIVIIAS